VQQAPEEIYQVFKGKTKSFGLTGVPYIQAKGHFMGFAFKFWMEGRDTPVANMEMIHAKMNKFTGLKKQRYRVTIEAGVDPIMISMLIGFIDTCNDRGVR